MFTVTWSHSSLIRFEAVVFKIQILCNRRNNAIFCTQQIIVLWYIIRTQLKYISWTAFWWMLLIIDNCHLTCTMRCIGTTRGVPYWGLILVVSMSCASVSLARSYNLPTTSTKGIEFLNWEVFGETASISTDIKHGNCCRIFCLLVKGRKSANKHYVFM